VRLISTRTETGETLGVVDGERWLPAADLLDDGPKTIADLLAGGPAALSALRTRASSGRIATDGRSTGGLDLLAPVPRPGKIVAIGRNYREHVEEEKADTPPAPLIFAKWPSAVVGDGAEIHWDPALTEQVDWEAELAVVIGSTARNVAVDNALEHVLGYTCLNDVSARDLQFGDGQWTRGKSLDTFCPMGPAIVTADEIPDPQTLAISCVVDGEVVQESTTERMFFGVAEIISFCSRSFTLEPGDVIATGTPGGVGVFRDPPRFLADGSVVAVEIERVGRLTNTCRHVPVGARPPAGTSPGLAAIGGSR
jgi:2-keto-4-pentenoate hydratase/2-oxohepta-3-ene-1,7-dioic acid hydratase in catechol pathway